MQFPAPPRQAPCLDQKVASFPHLFHLSMVWNGRFIACADYPTAPTSHPSSYFHSNGRQCVSDLLWRKRSPRWRRGVGELLAQVCACCYAVGAAMYPPERGTWQRQQQGVQTALNAFILFPAGLITNLPPSYSMVSKCLKIN